MPGTGVRYGDSRDQKKTKGPVCGGFTLGLWLRLPGLELGSHNRLPNQWRLQWLFPPPPVKPTEEGCGEGQDDGQKGWRQPNGCHLCVRLTALLAVASVSPGPASTPLSQASWSLCRVACSLGPYFSVSASDSFCVKDVSPAAWWVLVSLSSILNRMLSNDQINYSLEAFAACTSKQSELIYHCQTATFQGRKKYSSSFV